MTHLKRFLFPVLFLVLVAASIARAEVQPAVDLETLINQAFAANPDLLAANERWQMITEKAHQAGTFDNPMAMLRVQNALIKDPFDFTRDSMTAKVVGVSQKFPFFGKRALMKEEAGLAAESERWIVAERRLELRRMIQETWYQIYRLDRSLEGIASNSSLLDSLQLLAENMYSAGKTSQQEIFQAQLERSKMEEMRLLAIQKRQSAVSLLNSFLARPADAEIPNLPKIEVQPKNLAAADLEALAYQNRPILKQQEAKIGKADAGHRLAEKELYPDITLTLEYMQRDPAMNTPGDDMYGAQVSFELPIQHEQRRAKIAESQAEKRMATYELAATKNQIRLAIHDALAQLDKNERLMKLYRSGILIQADNALESALSSYRANTVSLSEVLKNHIARFNAEQEYHGAVAEYQMQVAALEAAVGMPLSAAINTQQLPDESRRVQP